jgi:hypothetical protein
MTPRERAKIATVDTALTGGLIGWSIEQYEALLGGIEEAITTAIEEECEACAILAQQKVDKLKTLLKGNPSEEGFAYSSVTASDIRDAIRKRAYCNKSATTINSTYCK